MITVYPLEPIILSFLTALIVAAVSMPSLIKVAYFKNLVDAPDGDRKVHKRIIPSLGGIIIFAATIFSVFLWFPSDYLKDYEQLLGAINNSKYIVSTVIIVFFVGVKDDIIGTSPMKKLIAHILVAFILVLMGDIRITSMKGILGVYELPYWASIFLSMFTYTVVVNAFNLIDGVDGLAAGVGFVASVAFGIWFYYAGSYDMSVLAFSLAGSLLGFLFFNFSPAKIFMGDSGSLIIGLILSVLSIKLIEYDAAKLPNFMVHITKPVFVLSCLSYPLIDTLRVFILRILKGRSPFSADRNHIHHRLLDIGLSHASTSIFVYGYSLLMVFMSIVITVGPTLTFLAIGGVAILLLQIPFLFKKRVIHNTRLEVLKDDYAKEASGNKNMGA